VTFRSFLYIFGCGRYYIGGRIECQYETDYQFQQKLIIILIFAPALIEKITAKITAGTVFCRDFRLCDTIAVSYFCSGGQVT